MVERIKMFSNIGMTLTPKIISKQEFTLTDEEEESALEEAWNHYDGSILLPLIVKLKSKSKPFKSVMFAEEIVKNMTPPEWWVSQKNISSEEEQSKNFLVVKQLFGAIASSVAVERVFSTFEMFRAN